MSSTIDETPIPTVEELEAAAIKLMSDSGKRIARIYNESLGTPSFRIFVQGLIDIAGKETSKDDPQGFAAMGKLVEVMFASGMVAMEEIMAARAATTTRPN